MIHEPTSDTGTRTGKGVQTVIDGGDEDAMRNDR
jgi:hypothetical protein